MRLIDADKFILALMDASLSSVDEDTILDLIDSIPTVDAVPVVRCKGCEHSREQNEDEKKYLVEGVLICTSCDATENYWNPVFPEHFCSYGERKDNG